MQLTSPDFENGERIPVKFTCDGEDINPELDISEVPDGVESLILIVDDPDAPDRTFNHWIVWNIPADTGKIMSGTLPVGALEGMNSAGKLGYMGPCPPSGTHHYVFTLYALDTKLEDLDPLRTDCKLIMDKMTGHIVASAELSGLYYRSEN